MEHWYSKVQRQALIFVFKIKKKSFGWFCGSINCFFFFIYHFWNYVEIGFIAKKWISSKFWTVQRRVNSCTSIQVVVQSFSWCPAILISYTSLYVSDKGNIHFPIILIIAVECDDPGKPSNGEKIVTKGYVYGGSVKFVCDENYSLVGTDVIYCHANRSWSSSVPRCLGKFHGCEQERI